MPTTRATTCPSLYCSYREHELIDGASLGCSKSAADLERMGIRLVPDDFDLVMHFECTEDVGKMSSLYSTTIDKLIPVDAPSGVHANALFDSKLLKVDLTTLGAGAPLPGLEELLCELGSQAVADILASMSGSSAARRAVAARNLQVEEVFDLDELADALADELADDDDDDVTVPMVTQRNNVWVFAHKLPQIMQGNASMPSSGNSWSDCA